MDTLLAIDRELLLWCNSLAHVFFLVDHWLSHIVHLDLAKFAVLSACILGLWFLPGASGAEGKDHERSESEERRRLLLSGFFVVIVTVGLTRALAASLPFRTRPLATPSLELVRAWEFSHGGLSEWSSFPSDHASLAGALSVLIFLVSRRLGVFAFTWSLLVILLPRVIHGIHWPSDVLAGLILGGTTMALLAPWLARRRILGRCLRLEDKHPMLWNALLFLYLYQIATLFDGARLLLWLLGSSLERLLGL